MEFVGSKRLGLPDKVVGLWVRGTVGLSVRRVSGIWESFKFGCVFRLRYGFRLSVRVGYGFQICGGFGLWALGFKYGLRGIGPRVKNGLGCK